MQSRLLIPGPSVCFTGQHWPAKGLQEETEADVTAYRWERRYTVQPRPRFHISTCAEPIIAAVTCGNGDVADMPWMMMMMMMMMYASYKAGERAVDDKTGQTAHHYCRVYNIQISKQSIVIAIVIVITICNAHKVNA